MGEGEQLTLYTEPGWVFTDRISPFPPLEHGPSQDEMVQGGTGLTSTYNDWIDQGVVWCPI